jgi:hypothetical protein
MQKWTRDFRHAARSLARAPGFTLVVVATLALAIGANATIFSVVNAVLLEPLPFPHADRLVHIGGTAPGTDQPEEFGVRMSCTSSTARALLRSKTSRCTAPVRPRRARKGRSTSSS